MTMSTTGEHQTIVMPQTRRGPGEQADPGPRIGSRLGKYRLCLELASGGMSTVFLGRCQEGVGRNRFVAIKCLKPWLAADSAYVEMFLDEARVSSMLHHPNICDVLDFRVQGGISYMVLELLEGHSAAAILRQQRELPASWPPARVAGVAARIVADAAEGLHAAHELTDAYGRPLNVVHRDVSPENVFVTYDGVAKVMDFGVALDSQQRHQTQPGTLKGKYSYLAPEVLRGGKPDRRSDVWGLGMLAWELMVGRRMFTAGNDVELLRAVLDHQIEPPSCARPGVPVAFDDVVMRALDRDPARRIPTARELARKLTCVLVEELMAIGLAEVSDFLEQLFPSGRACARQLRDTVERMEDPVDPDDGTEDATVASPLSAPVGAIATPRLPSGALPHRRGIDRARWLKTLAPPIAALGIVAADLALRGHAAAPTDAPPDPPPQAQVLHAPRARAATLAAATCTPDAVASPTDAPIQVELQPVQLPSGEVVFRLRPRGSASLAAAPF
jgi:serine/threonine-protein kinase